MAEEKENNGTAVGAEEQQQLQETPQKHICVVGAGVVGLSTAHYLATAGHRVTVVDQAKALGRGASYRSAGIINGSLATPSNDPDVFLKLKSVLCPYLSMKKDKNMVSKMDYPSFSFNWGWRYLKNCREQFYQYALKHTDLLARYSRDLTRELCDTIDVPYTSGTMEVFYEEPGNYNDHCVKLDGLVKDLVANDVKILSFETVPKLEPAIDELGIGEDVLGSIYAPHNMVINTREYCKRMALYSQQKLGVDFRPSTRVLGYSIDANEGEITALHTDKGDIKADSYIFCAGLGTSKLLQAKNDTLPNRLKVVVPLQALKGYAIDIKANPNYTLKHALVFPEKNITVTQMEKTIRLSTGEDWDANEQNQKVVDAGKLAHLMNFASDLFPWLSQHDYVGRPWAGHRSVSVDGLPMIGLLPGYKNLYVNAGHGHWGFTLAAASGKICANLVNQQSGDAAAASEFGSAVGDNNSNADEHDNTMRHDGGQDDDDGDDWQVIGEKKYEQVVIGSEQIDITAFDPARFK